MTLEEQLEALKNEKRQLTEKVGILNSEKQSIEQKFNEAVEKRQKLKDKLNKTFDFKEGTNIFEALENVGAELKDFQSKKPDIELFSQNKDYFDGFVKDKRNNLESYMQKNKDSFIVKNITEDLGISSFKDADIATIKRAEKEIEKAEKIKEELKKEHDGRFDLLPRESFEKTDTSKNDAKSTQSNRQHTGLYDIDEFVG